MRIRSFLILLSLGWMALSGAASAWGQQATAEPESASQEPDPGEEEEIEKSFLDRLAIHGYLSQAYAVSDGNQIGGIPEEGTADYRTAALQIRTEIGEQDTFALQLSHERLGQSDLQTFQQDVALDWLFYERRFANSSVKVGRVQIPFGIYNEVRDVGTLLPFYRPSTNFYGEGSYTSETVDGIVLSHAFDLGGAWELDGDLHYGNWEFVNRGGGEFEKRKVRDSIGVELWLTTPVPGLRIGTGGMRYDVEEPDGNRWKTYHISLEGELGRVTTHMEYKLIDFADGTYDAGYVHVGVRAADKITVNGQYDYSDLSVNFFREGDFDDDTALGVNYAFRPDLVLKLEHHWNEGYTPEDPSQNFFAPKLETRYWIASLSASF